MSKEECCSIKEQRKCGKSVGEDFMMNFEESLLHKNAKNP
jgi:hypothetical protein